MDKIATFEAEIAETLFKSLKLLNYSCSEIANAVGRTEKDIQSYVSGESIISAGTLFAIAKAIRIPVENFIEQAYPDTDEITDAEALSFLQAFARVENSTTRGKILQICRLYEDLHKDTELVR